MKTELVSKLDAELRRDLRNDEINEIKDRLSNIVSKEDFDKQVEVMKAIDAYGVDQLRLKLKSIHGKHFEREKVVKRKSNTWIWLTLAVLIFSLVAGIIYINSSKSKSPSDIYASYYQPYNYSNTKRAAAESSIISLGILYNEKNYHKFIDVFEESFKNQENLQSDLILASGIAYLETDAPYKAIFQFNKIIENQDFNYEESAIWYSALALFKAEEYNACKTKLEELVSDNGSSYHSKSKDLIKELNRIIQ